MNSGWILNEPATKELKLLRVAMQTQEGGFFCSVHIHIHIYGGGGLPYLKPFKH